MNRIVPHEIESNQLSQKLSWSRPEIMIIDLDSTESGALSSPVENTTGHS